MQTGRTFDRSRQDVGNILFLEHVNVRVPNQETATDFWVDGLGLTRDPYLRVGTDNMWVNVGQSQFHMPRGGPHVIQGLVDLVLPEIDSLPGRLEAVKERLAGTAFTFSVEGTHVSATCPWGNRVRCFPPAPEFLGMTLGMARVEVPVERGHAEGIARFYREIMDAPATTAEERGHAVTRVKVGNRQWLVFRETAEPIRPWDGNHIAIYIRDFSGPHRRLAERGLIAEESDEYQYRFDRIADPESGALLARLEHEVRSFTHPMAFRPLVNRNPEQTQPRYKYGRDAFYPPLT
jgi:catechol 2,3-dioxygenase-like lactoylglutathione lyase family enzyme